MEQKLEFNKSILSKIVIFVFFYEVFFKVLVYYYFEYFQIDLNKNIITFINFCLLVLVLFYEILKNRESFKKYLLLLLFFLYMLVYLIYHYFYGKYYITNEVIYFQFKLMLWSLYWFILSILLYKYLEKKELKKLSYIIFTMFIFFILFHIDFGTNRMHVPYINGAHQLIGNSISILGLFLLVFIERKYVRYFVMTLVLITLFYIAGRGAFFSFFVVYTVFLLKEIGFKNSIFLALFFSLIIVFSLYFDLIKLDTRMLGITQIFKDGSFIERLEQFKYGIEAIKQNWFFGEFAGQIIVHETGYRSGMMGAYMHNILSFWRQYGLLFFLAFSITYFYLLFRVFLLWLKDSSNKLQFIFYFGIYCATLLIFFQGYNQPQFWFCMGLMFSYIHNNVKKELYVK